MFLSCLDRVCPCDLDDVLSYRMPRYTYLQHRMLGFVQLSLTVIVFLYIAVIELWYNKGYAVKEVPVGVSRITAERPAWNPLPVTPSDNFTYCCDPTNVTATSTGCPPAWQTPVSLPTGHRQRLPCLAWDEVEMQQPNFEEYSLFLATRVTVTEYQQVPQALNCRLNVDNNCHTAMSTRGSTVRDYYVTDPESVLIMMQHTIYSKGGLDGIRQSSGNARPDDIYTASMKKENGDDFMNFCVADLSDSLNPAILAPQRRGSTHESEQDKSCDESRKTRWGDILTIGQLLQTLRIEQNTEPACLNGLDCTNGFNSADSYRYDGITILIPMIFAQAGTDQLEYIYEPKWIRGQRTESSYTTQKWMEGKETKTEYRGVRIQVVHVGTVGQFAFIEVLKTIVAGLSLLGIANFIIERIVLVLPCWGGVQHLFNRYIYIYSHDFSSIDMEFNPKDPDLPFATVKTRTGKRNLNDELFTRGNTMGRYQGANDGSGAVKNVCCGIFRAANHDEEWKGTEADPHDHYLSKQEELAAIVAKKHLEDDQKEAEEKGTAY